MYNVCYAHYLTLSIYAMNIQILTHIDIETSYYMSSYFQKEFELIKYIKSLLLQLL